MPRFDESFDLLLLTAVGGTMDALSYLSSGVFTANMTGNTVVLGLAAAGFDRSRLVPACVSLAAFACGAALAAAVLLRVDSRDHQRDLKIGTAWEFPFIAIFAVLTGFTAQTHPAWAKLPLIIAAACSLGIQSVAVRRLKISGVATTFITGTITIAIISAIRKPAAETEQEGLHPNSPLLLGAIFVLYVVAAAAAASIATQHATLAALIPVVLLIVVMSRSWGV